MTMEQSDVDDPADELVDLGEPNLNLLGAGILARPAQIEFTNRNIREEPHCNRRRAVTDSDHNNVEDRQLDDLESPKKKSAKRMYLEN